MTRVLVTNHGPHTADQLALATAEQLTEANPHMEQDRMLAVQRLRLDLAEALTPMHATNQIACRTGLQSGFTEDCSDDRTIAEAMDAVNKVTDQTPWKDHYRKAEVQEVARSILARHFQHARDIERSWHRDREGQN